MTIKMCDTYHTLERKPILGWGIARLHTHVLLRLLHLGKRKDKDGCSSPTNCISFIASHKAAVNFHVHIKHSTSKGSCQMWTDYGQESLRGQTSGRNAWMASG